MNGYAIKINAFSSDDLSGTTYYGGKNRTTLTYGFVPYATEESARKAINGWNKFLDKAGSHDYHRYEIDGVVPVTESLIQQVEKQETALQIKVARESEKFFRALRKTMAEKDAEHMENNAE